MILRIAAAALCLAAAVALVGAAQAHITPPVTLVSDRDAVASLLAGAAKFTLREVSVTPEERKLAQSEYGWRPRDESHAFYMGRDAGGGLVAASVIMTEPTIHGPIRVAVGFAPDGRVKAVRMVEVSEEIYMYMKPMLDRGFAARYAGLGAGSKFESSGASTAGVDAMQQHYDDLVSRLVERAAILYELGVRKRGGA